MTQFFHSILGQQIIKTLQQPLESASSTWQALQLPQLQLHLFEVRGETSFFSSESIENVAFKTAIEISDISASVACNALVHFFIQSQVELTDQDINQDQHYSVLETVEPGCVNNDCNCSVHRTQFPQFSRLQQWTPGSSQH